MKIHLPRDCRPKIAVSHYGGEDDFVVMTSCSDVACTSVSRDS